ncbi:hypothetical protein AADG42_08225 [Ammonicoccus fulvus]|uniref:Bacteriocin biosynthesis cyclodehydratase domain-containing protein n=1 Tax=Ammonicoccus fulvus TaxID=3138240 RepID=A0ABZ3FRA9_9ACTN
MVERSLPKPRLRSQLPILMRNSDELQIGSVDALVLRGSSPALNRALRLLDGSHSLDRIALDSGLTLPEVRSLVARLRREGLLVPPRPAAPPLVRLLGAGRLARAFAEAYAESGAGDLLLVEPAPAPATEYATPHLLPTGAETLRAHLRARGHHRVRCAPHWYRPEGPEPTLTVIAFDRPECDRAVTDTMVRSDQPHLFVRPLDDGVIVGPFVVPGETCCTRCQDLVRARDSAWPQVLAQLCRVEIRPTPELTAWAATTALLQVRAWLAGVPPETLGATLETRPGNWALAQRHWPHHPDCGCGELRLAG